MKEHIIISGSGGQGIMLMGKVLATAAMKENKYVTWFPAYGAEVRGGTAYCMVIISDAEISSPYIEKADTLIMMNAPSLERFEARIKNKGLIIINGSLAKQDIKSKAHILRHPFTDIALRLGNIKIANMVALGCFIAQGKIVDKASVIKVMQEMAPSGRGDLIEINALALEEGVTLK